MHTAAARAPSSRPEHELKLVTPARRADIVASWLAGVCRPDPRHPGGRVTSIYFDNRAALLLRAKVNSDFVKHKVRVRWYTDPETGTVEEPAFVEIKRKIGGRRFKARVALASGSAALAAGKPPASLLRALLGALRAEGHWVDADLQPFLRITFRRRRYIDPVSRARVALDADIRADSANPALLPQRNPRPLAHAVIEIKGPYERLPPSLAALRALGCVPESFSKYARGYQRVVRRASF